MQALAATDLLSFAAVAVAGRDRNAPLLAAGALNVALRGALRNAEANIQIHGGMGFSQECTAHHVLKRARLIEAIAGRMSSVRRRVLQADFSRAG
jgi:alkylation response protein AidB-like acyl-CoA dehydrogenase